MRYFPCFALLALLLLPLSAEDIFDYPLTEQTRPSLEALFGELSSHEIIRSPYIQRKTISALNRDITSSGLFLFHKDKGLAWMVSDPFPMNIVLNENEMIQQIPGGTSQSLSFADNPSFAGFSGTVQSIFLGEMETVEKNYEIFYHEAAGKWLLALKPLDKTLYSVVDYFLLEGSGTIESFLIAEPRGDKITYAFDDLEYPESLTGEESHVFP